MPCSMHLPRSCLPTLIRSYATRPSGYAKRILKNPKSPITLEFFLQRAKAIALWRTIIRGSRRIADEQTREEALKFAREEFRRNMNENDITHIRYLISTGRTQWEAMERYIDGL